ncbi:metallophosphoesterase [Roseivivax marinus]|uniref:metallophosphoesterase family protein n=1 Tax=Roseivivax marinus TaxID=1379903 RepID=UPI001F04D113|nr:metallophosphoesterase [Roseivivax marinus]UMA63578.1 metallophosphoesterase [Roseivivax marinus]
MAYDLIHSSLAIRLEGVLFYGDPHGRWGPLFEALDSDIHTVFILGDLAEAKRNPLQVDDACQALKLIQDRGVNWHTISGNHDSDTAKICDLVFYELEEQLANGRVITVKTGDVKVAGLGGVIRGRIWDGEAKPYVRSPDELLAKTPKQERYRHGLPFKKRSTIFPSTVDYLSEQKADVLITHEAPSCHPNGFKFIDKLADAMGVELIVHGHHHTSYNARLDSGVKVKGLGLAEAWRLESYLSPTQRKLLRSGLTSMHENERAYKALKDK